MTASLQKMLWILRVNMSGVINASSAKMVGVKLSFPVVREAQSKYPAA